MTSNHDTTTKKWIDEMIAELRLREVRGDAIGDAVAQVESDLAASGADPVEEFGPPRDYARSLEFTPAQTDHTAPAEWLKILGPVFAGVFGVTTTTQSVQALLHHQHIMPVEWGQLASLLVLAGLSTGLVLFARSLLRSRGVFMVFMGVGAVVMVLLATTLHRSAFHVPPAAGLAVSLALLGISVVGQRRVRLGADWVRDPLTHEARPGTGILWAASDWIIVIIAGIGALLAVLVR